MPANVQTACVQCIAELNGHYSVGQYTLLFQNSFPYFDWNLKKNRKFKEFPIIKMLKKFFDRNFIISTKTHMKSKSIESIERPLF